MPHTKECKSKSGLPEEKSFRKILTLSGLKDRKRHENRTFSIEGCDAPDVKSKVQK